MATYEELHELANNSGMKNKVRVAIAIAADRIAQVEDTGTNFDQTAGAHDKRRTWVNDAKAFRPSEELAQEFWNAMLAANNTLAVAGITGATDLAIQNNVEQVIDILAGN